MYTVHYTSDVVRGKKNYGSDRVLENLSKSAINTIINDLDNAYGKSKTISGVCVWNNCKDTHTISIFKNNKPISYKDFKNE